MGGFFLERGEEITHLPGIFSSKNVDIADLILISPYINVTVIGHKHTFRVKSVLKCCP